MRRLAAQFAFLLAGTAGRSDAIELGIDSRQTDGREKVIEASTLVLAAAAHGAPKDWWRPPWLPSNLGCRDSLGVAISGIPRLHARAYSLKTPLSPRVISSCR